MPISEGSAMNNDLPKLGAREWAALADIAVYPGNYYWRQKSMARLEQHGYVARSGGYRIPAYGITHAGMKALAAYRSRDSA